MGKVPGFGVCPRLQAPENVIPVPEKGKPENEVQKIRWTKKVSVWPVGFASRMYAIGSPIVQNGNVVGFHDGFRGNEDQARKFAIDMAGFAVSIPFLFRRPHATMGCKQGFLEDQFLLSLEVSIDELEPKAENCVQVFEDQLFQKE
ncbi:galactosylgalactosylxylosylprotein 3-beta-glucuronosyltransferase 2-like, partial [Limulus polyphemus]|uniref:Galactosylgalactosylxylosylprotein 3-beta-glucuronosyltransferase n=1 Tax=Limulus polyphemus TaxID=6850 RepID=A0ABM1TIB3_LIMPO